jgi:hypothetical protein
MKNTYKFKRKSTFPLRLIKNISFLPFAQHTLKNHKIEIMFNKLKEPRLFHYKIKQT